MKEEQKRTSNWYIAKTHQTAVTKNCSKKGIKPKPFSQRDCRHEELQQRLTKNKAIKPIKTEQKPELELAKKRKEQKLKPEITGTKNVPVSRKRRQ